MKNRIILGIAMIVMFIVSGCITDNSGTTDEIIVISDGDIVDPTICQQKGISDTVVVFHSPTCPACKQTIPVLEEIDNEYDYNFVFIDLSTERDVAEELGIMPTHIPTVLIKCTAYTGFREKADFLSLMGD